MAPAATGRNQYGGGGDSSHEKNETDDHTNQECVINENHILLGPLFYFSQRDEVLKDPGGAAVKRRHLFVPRDKVNPLVKLVSVCIYFG